MNEKGKIAKIEWLLLAATALFLWFGAEPMCEKLDRLRVRYGLFE